MSPPLLPATMLPHLDRHASLGPCSPVSTFYHLFFIRTREKPLQTYVWSFHSHIHHLQRSHLQRGLKGQFFLGRSPTSWPCSYPLHPQCSPLSLSLLPSPRAEAYVCCSPRTFVLYLLVFTGMVVRHLPHNIRTVPTASKLHGTPSFPFLCHSVLLICPLMRAVSHIVSVLYWKVPGVGTFVVFIYLQH